MLEVLKTVNSDYAGILSLLFSIIMVIVTIIYVGHTKRQANYSKNSVELIAKQIRTDKQPCIVPYINSSFGSAFDATNYTRIQLGFIINLKNVGDAPAIIVYTLANIELQLSHDDSGNKKLLTAALLPRFVQALAVGEEKEVNIHFETAEVKALVRELRTAMDMNAERLKTNPSHHHYSGAKLVISVLFRNMMGQWCECSISHEIPWLEFANPPQRITHNLNENTIPPRELQNGDRFRAVVSSSELSPFVYNMVTAEYVKDTLKQYVDDSPWLEESFQEIS